MLPAANWAALALPQVVSSTLALVYTWIAMEPRPLASEALILTVGPTGNGPAKLAGAVKLSVGRVSSTTRWPILLALASASQKFPLAPAAILTVPELAVGIA